MTWYEYFNLIVMDILRFLARFSTGRKDRAYPASADLVVRASR